jgi:UDP-glucose 4-epimerase
VQTVLITGGAGFIGSHVAQECLDHGCTVIVVDDLSGGSVSNLPPGVDFCRADICNRRAIDELFRQYKPEAVYHLAAYAAEGLSPFIRRFNATINGVGSATILSAVLKHETPKLVFTSSIAVYGEARTPYREDHAGHPVDPYGAYKWAAELDIRAAQATYGLDYTIWRPHNVFGPHQNLNDPYRNVVGIFMKAALLDKPMRIFGDGTQVRAFSYVKPVARVIAESGWDARYRNTTLNVGGSQPTTIIGLARHVEDVSGNRVGVEYLPARHEIHTATASHERLAVVQSGRRSHGSPEIRLVEGLSLMWDWAQAQTDLKPTPLPCEIEVFRGLPPSWGLRD